MPLSNQEIDFTVSAGVQIGEAQQTEFINGGMTGGSGTTPFIGVRGRF